MALVAGKRNGVAIELDGHKFKGFVKVSGDHEATHLYITRPRIPEADGALRGFQDSGYHVDKVSIDGKTYPVCRGHIKQDANGHGVVIKLMLPVPLTAAPSEPAAVDKRSADAEYRRKDMADSPTDAQAASKPEELPPLDAAPPEVK